MSELGLLTAEDLIKRVRNDRTRVCVWWFGPGWRRGSRKQKILDLGAVRKWGQFYACAS